MAVFASCMHSRPDEGSSIPTESWSLFDTFNAPKALETVDIVVEHEKEKHLLARFNTANCLEPQHRWTLMLQSEFGEHSMQVQFGSAPNEHGAVATVGAAQVLIDEASKIAPESIAKICEEANTGTDQITVSDPAIEKQVLLWIARIAPDCRLAVENGGTWCHLRKIEPRVAEEELRSIRLTMIRRWSRQPYILSRRLSVSINLAKALQSADKNRSLDILCRVINYSDPLELPLSLSSVSFQKSVCAKISGNRVDAAAASLTKAMDEIELLRQLFERTSKLGVLAIRVPKDKAPTKDLWISLTPDETVAESLAAEAAKLSAEDQAQPTSTGSKTEPGNFGSAKACWHPLFSDKTGRQVEIANHLDLVGNSPNISCASLGTQQGQTSYRYLADSITSETEFVITNGRAKLLRLPNGSYNYKITGHSQTMGWEPIPDKETTGQVSWQGRRPNASIKTW